MNQESEMGRLELDEADLKEVSAGVSMDFFRKSIVVGIDDKNEMPDEYMLSKTIADRKAR